MRAVTTESAFLRSSQPFRAGAGVKLYGKSRKDKAVGICIHYTYIQTRTFDSTPCLRVASPPFLSRAFPMSELCVEPQTLSNQTPRVLHA